MEAYTSFAQVYDLFMDNIPYQEWGDYVKELLTEQGAAEGIVLDLGCGTGSITRELAAAGYDMIGVDNSQEMLQLAMERGKPAQADREILYLLQDMREFELYGTVSAVVSICDSLNYILEKEELLLVFSLVNNYLDPGGIFIFDLNTPYKYRDLLADTTFAENRERASFIWENYFDEEESVNEYLLTLFIEQPGDGETAGLYQKFEEIHYQRAYELETVKELLQKAGMVFVAAYDAFTHESPHPESERIYVIARECGKQCS